MDKPVFNSTYFVVAVVVAAVVCLVMVITVVELILKCIFYAMFDVSKFCLHAIRCEYKKGFVGITTLKKFIDTVLDRR